MAIIDTSLKDLTEKLVAMQEAAAVAEADLRCTFTWQGATIPCVGGPQFEGKDLDIGGWVKRRKVKIKFRTVNLPDSETRPAEGHVIEYFASEGGIAQRYRIKSTRVWFDVIMELECEDSNQ